MIPFSTLGERLDFIARAGLAYALMAIFFVLNVSALPYPFTGIIKIPFILITIFYWSLYRPTFLPAPLVFLCGLMFDLLSASPLGFNTIIFLITRWVIADQRSFLLGQSFIVVWLAFTVLNVVTLCLQWLVFGILQTHFVSITSIFPMIGIGAVTYPFIVLLLHISHKLLPDPRIPLTRQSSADGFTHTK